MIKKKIIIALTALGLGAIVAKAATSKKIITLSGLPKNGNWPNRDTAGITDITIHHSAGTDTETIADMANWHVNGRGWPGIAYHFVIDKKGQIYQTNPIEKYTYHNGFNNRGAIGICVQGNFENTYPSGAQIYALYWLIRYLKQKYPSIKYLMGHKEYEGTTLCPGKNINLDLMRTGTGLSYNPKGLKFHPANIPTQYVVGSESDN